MIIRGFTTAVTALVLSACQHGTSAVPAVLADGSDETITALKAHLAEAMGVANVSLGAGDPTVMSSVSVLPPRLGDHETRSPALPTVFHLMLERDACYAVREGSEERLNLSGVPCRAL